MRLFILLFLCGTIVGSNDTLNNEISQEEGTEPSEQVNKHKPVGNKTLSEVFDYAVEAYLEEDWDECIERFNEALHGYKLYKRIVINCRQKCKAEAAGAAPVYPENIEDMHFYEQKVRETLCLLMCNQDYREFAGPKAFKKLAREVEKKFVDRSIYEYLHICYYQRNRHQDAANAIFTYLVKHPNHEASVETLKHYLTLPDVNEEMVLNLEAAPYLTFYLKGVAAYDDEDYKEAAGLFESSLRSYLDSEEECRIYCEGPFDQGWHPDFIPSIANHFTYCLKCKQMCSHSLNSINGNYRNDMLRSHYDYLQFSYYKLGKLKAACAAVESFLLFAPADETMLHNKEYYAAQPKVQEEYFTPREEAVSYVKRQQYELRVLSYIVEEFSIMDARLKAYEKKNETMDKIEEKKLGKKFTSETILYPPPGHSPSSHALLTRNLSMIRDEEKEIRDTERPRVRADVYLVAEEKELGGRNRYVADGFINSTECQSLIELALVAGVEGDGYNENKSPHSVYEKFEGLAVGRIALMVYFGQVEADLLMLLLEKTEAARDHVERYFQLYRQLYFTYTHLVCRTALPDSPLDRNDLSHEVHADNCLLNDQNICAHQSPAYVWRDYSAILYLNDDFQGGEFFFTKEKKSRKTDRIVLPSCGRMVAFSAGEENLHGVRAVLKGKRCALALWFTQDERYTEYERVLARAILKRVRLLGPSKIKDFQVPLRYEDVLIDCFKKDKFLRQLLWNSS